MSHRKRANFGLVNSLKMKARRCKSYSFKYIERLLLEGTFIAYES